MWLYQNKTIQVGRSWTDSKGVKHPRTWSNWTEARKKQVGLTFKADPVVQAYDARFYYSAGNARPLVSAPAKDDKGQVIKDQDGNDVMVIGLKEAAISATKAKAGALLEETDWYVTRYAETGEDIPADVTTKRAAIRTAANTIETAIKGAKTLAAFIKLYEAPADGVAPIEAWPA